MFLDNGEMDFLYGGVADCAGWVIACSGGEREGEGVEDSVEEIDDTFRACACALGGGQSDVAERLRRAGEDFRALFSQVRAHSNRSQPAGLPNLADIRINDVVGVRQLRLRLSCPFSISRPPAYLKPPRLGLGGQSFGGQIVS
jgi:hypothetical protein